MAGDDKEKNYLARRDHFDQMMDEFFRWPHELDNLFRPFYGMMPFFGFRTPLEYTEEKEDGTGLVSRLEMPGIKNPVKDISVVVEDGFLNIDGARKEEKEEGEKGKRGYRHSMASANYHMRLGLPDEIDEDKITSTYENGILILDMPYRDLAKKKPEAKKIEVKTK